MRQAPALAPVVLSQMKGKAAGFRAAYVMGAVIGYERYEYCYAVQFRRAWSTKQIKRNLTRVELRKMSAVGLSVDAFFPPFDQGVMFGCTFFR
ncbi:MAG TPA: hypothetical protein VMB53_06360 [Gaiellaceae bacterium]|nr:hypothetical protein [Gaiellaceae bacterium]